MFLSFYVFCYQLSISGRDHFYMLLHYMTSHYIGSYDDDDNNNNNNNKLKLNSVTLVRKRTIRTERPPLVGEVSANFSR
jgi:hypothetical protein